MTGDTGDRIPSRTLQDAPAACVPLLEDLLQFSPTGHLLNLHAQMAESPAVLSGYVALRKTSATHASLTERVRTALMLACAAVSANDYALRVISLLAARAGWSEGQVAALSAGKDVGEPSLDTLIAVIRQAAADQGRVEETAWQRAKKAGWSDQQLAEAFAYLGLTVYTAYFLNYARTRLDLPDGH
jgi:hypothetical protein